MASQTNELDEGELDTNSPNRRQFKNFIIKPKFQLKYVNWFISGAFTIMVTTVGLIQYRLQQVDHLLNVNVDTQVGAQLPVYSAFSDITVIALAGFVIFTIYASTLAIMINHRVSGPMIAIVHCIDEIRHGNYHHERELRDKDELQPIHEALIDLSRSLRNKQ